MLHLVNTTFLFSLSDVFLENSTYWGFIRLMLTHISFSYTYISTPGSNCEIPLPHWISTETVLRIHQLNQSTSILCSFNVNGIHSFIHPSQLTLDVGNPGRLALPCSTSPIRYSVTLLYKTKHREREKKRNNAN